MLLPPQSILYDILLTSPVCYSLSLVEKQTRKQTIKQKTTCRNSELGHWNRLSININFTMPNCTAGMVCFYSKVVISVPYLHPLRAPNAKESLKIQWKGAFQRCLQRWDWRYRHAWCALVSEWAALTQSHSPKGPSSPGCWEPAPWAMPKWAGINTIATLQWIDNKIRKTSTQICCEIQVSAAWLRVGDATENLAAAQKVHVQPNPHYQHNTKWEMGWKNQGCSH